MRLRLDDGVVRGHGRALLLLARIAGQIRLVEEPGEQHEVAEVHGYRQLDVERGDVALCVLLQELPCPHVNRAADDHLQQLQRRDNHGDLPRGPVAHRSQSVVTVHHGMHAVIHDDEPASAGRVLRVAEPRVEQHSNVVVPMQEDQGLFTQHYEDRVAQLGQLAQHEHPRPEAGHFVLLDERGYAHGVVQSVVGQGVQELRHSPASAHDAERGQGGVPDREDAPELEPGPVLHQVLAAEDQDHVDADVVEAERPVLDHPFAGLLVDEVRLEVEDVRVVWQRDLSVVLHGSGGSWHFQC